MRNMRLGCAVASVLVLSVLPSVAQDNTPPTAPISNVLQAIAKNPDGWTRNMDGSYRHAASDVLCPVQFKTFTLQSVSGPETDRPNILGVCRYKDGAGRMGSIRIRKYVEGFGSNQSIAENDKKLMSPNPPPMLMRASTDRRTAASRLTVTTVRNGYLVDCSVAQIEHWIPRGDFPLYCTTIPQ